MWYLFLSQISYLCDNAVLGKASHFYSQLGSDLKLVTGILNILFSVGSASGGPLGGFLADTVGWRWCFFYTFNHDTKTDDLPFRAFIMQVPVALFALVAVLLGIHITTRATSSLSITDKLRRVDFLGAFCLVFAVFSMLLGLDRGSNVSWSSPFSYVPLAISAVLVVAFAIIENTPRLAKEPFAPRHIMTNPSLLGSYLTNFFGFGASLCSTFHVVLYAQAVHRTSATAASAILLGPIFAGVSGSLVSGIIMQRTGKYKRLTICGGISLVGGLVLTDVLAYLSPSWCLIGISIGMSGSSSIEE